MIAESDQPVEHVRLGAALFPARNTHAVVRIVIHSHHERWDGLGYPQRKHHDATALNARIAAIADAYDAMIAAGDDRQPLANHAAAALIAAGAGLRFDPELVAHFSALVAPYPLGHEVTLPDGRDGVVAKLPRGDRLHPTVRLRSASGPIVELVADMAGEQASAAA
jgi:HD-GYP domain-containing protein (c-di-GMP phosphodiesterase class II)